MMSERGNRCKQMCKNNSTDLLRKFVYDFKSLLKSIRDFSNQKEDLRRPYNRQVYICGARWIECMTG